MSRFYAAGSDSDTGSSSDEEIEVQRPIMAKFVITDSIYAIYIN